MITIWFNILLSATCFSAAFLFPQFLAWTIVLFLPLLIPVFWQKRAFAHGFVWGIATYSIYSIWFFQLLRTHSQASMLLALGVYGIVVVYVALTSGLWFWATHKIVTIAERITRMITRRLLQGVSIIATTVGYFVLLDRWLLTPLGRVEGFSLLNPLIPLAHYGWFLKICALVCSLMYGDSLKIAPPHQKIPSTVVFLHLEPLVNKKKGEDKPWAWSSRGVGQEIFHQLHALNIQQYDDKQVFIVAPESTYRFALNQYPEIINLWATVLPKNAQLLIGALYHGDGKLFQAAYWIHQGRIINLYVKKHRLPFVEKIPNIWRKFQWLNELFLKDVVEFAPGKNKRWSKIFCLTPTLCGVPTLCSEFFFRRSIREFVSFKKILQKDSGRSMAIFLFVNNSWFNDYFCTILELFTRLKSAAIGLPVVYVTHEKVEVIGNLPL